MAEKLQQLKKKGGGSNAPNLGTPPDALYTNANMANGATATLTVTQKPRYIISAFLRTSTSGNYMFLITNVETGQGYRYGYWSSAFHNEVYNDPSIYITSITDTSIGIKNGYGGACYVTVGAYY